jgi:hypothetical protein
MKITKVRAALYQAHNVITGWKVSLGGRDTYDLVFQPREQFRPVNPLSTLNAFCSQDSMKKAY